MFQENQFVTTSTRPWGLQTRLRPPGSGTCVHPVVGLQLVLQAELLPAAVTFVGLLPGVDALVALQRVLVPEAAPAELALVRVVACCGGRVGWGGVVGGVGRERKSVSRLLLGSASTNTLLVRPKESPDCLTLRLLFLNWKC